jgi:hypothetical protein
LILNLKKIMVLFIEIEVNDPKIQTSKSKRFISYEIRTKVTLYPCSKKFSQILNNQMILKTNHDVFRKKILIVRRR